MITTCMLKSYFNIFRTLLMDLPLYPEFIYDPQLQFSTKIRERIVKNDVEFKASKGSDNWIAAVWNRDLVKKSAYTARRSKVYNSNTDGLVTNAGAERLVDLPVNITFFSTSLNLIEAVEEIIITTEMGKSYQSEIPGIGLVTASINNFDMTSLVKEDSTTMGSLSSIATSAQLTYPIIRLGNKSSTSIMSGVYATSSDIFLNSLINLSGEKLQVVTTDPNLDGKSLQIYAVDSNGALITSTVTLNSTTPQFTKESIIKVLGLNPEATGSDVKILNNDGSSIIWNNNIVASQTVGSIVPNISTSAQDHQLKVMVDTPLTGYVAVQGIDAAGTTTWELLHFNNETIKYTTNSYVTVNKLYVGDTESYMHLWSIMILGELAVGLIGQVGLNIYDWNGVKLN